MTPDYRALCAELLRSLENYPVQPSRDRDLCARARALLAEPESIQDRIAAADAAIEASMKRIRALAAPALAALAESDEPAVPDGREPASVALQPSDGEEKEAAAWLRLFCSEEYETRSHDPDVTWLTRAAFLLEQRHPAPVPVPVPVSERPPGPEDCDAEGLCWWWDPECEQTEGWIRGLPEYCNNNRSHWLPAHALPLPTPEATNG